MLIEDLQATIQEGVLGWLERNCAQQPNAARPGMRADGVMVVAERAVGAVRAVCEDWALEVSERDGQPGYKVLHVSGRGLVVLALCDTVAALRALGVRSA